ncbi:MAG: thiamine pyrophosphate-binding protein [Burkholderiales bacterium]
MAQLRGADVLVHTLANAGVRHLFSLSGNHIMPLYDAACDVDLSIVHVRHEGAAVHMADAWGRLTGQPGIALLTGGPGHANGVGALYTALTAESPLVMLSGHAPLAELGSGAFQEMRQADLAAPVVKASWTAQSAATLAADVARALRIARSGRPGPVHVSLPWDALEAKVEHDPATIPTSEAFVPSVLALGESAAGAVLDALKCARRPLVLTGPVTAAGRGQALRERLAAVLGMPVLCMESPRGVNDPALGAFAEVLAQADLILLLGKQLDFTLRFGKSPAVAGDARFMVVDADAAVLARALRTVGDSARVLFAAVAEPLAVMEALCKAAGANTAAAGQWAEEVYSAVRYRPREWEALVEREHGAPHPAAVGRAAQKLLDRSPDAIFVADGGEFGQWAQACVSAPTRLINGPGGSIGSALPFALAARLVRPGAPVVAMLGDGTFGFHMAEFDTAVRANLPFVAIVGNDACWNAEYQIQLRAYGRGRAHGCELLPARYDAVVSALGGHGEHVTTAAALPAALERAQASQRPACVNVMIERVAAPVVARHAPACASAAH